MNPYNLYLIRSTFQISSDVSFEEIQKALHFMMKKYC